VSNPLTLRLDERTRRRIERLARGKRVSTSDVIRDAIERWIEREAPASAPYQDVADLLGVVRGKNPKRSTRTGRAFTKLLKRRRKRK